MGHLLRSHILADVARLGGSASVLDFGCGGGDVLAALARAGARAGIHLRLVGLDGDPRPWPMPAAPLPPMPTRASFGGASTPWTIFPSPWTMSFAITCFTTFPPTRWPVFAQAAPDCPPAPHRQRPRALGQAYALYTALAAVAFRNSFAYGDGRLSIRKGFRVPEVQAACAQAGFPADCHVQRMPPWRVVIIAPGG